ncbi:MAG: GntR family transcriptional regulator [Actinobacteria bacterium]|nr:GntR family transcriptional regulator [Actinomycetota bacterium]
MAVATHTPSLSQFDHSGLNDKVYDRVRAALLSGELAPGQKLSLNSLSEQLGVSRSPVHQALTRLATEGLVDVRSRRGYFVTPITAKEVTEGYDVRLALELMAAERAVGTLERPQLDRLRAAFEAAQETMSPDRPWDLRAYIHANQRFHRLHLDLAGNDALSTIYGGLAVSLLMERVMADLEFADLSAEIGQQHAAIFTAFADADLAAAQAALRDHVELGRRMAVEAIEAAGGAR